MVFLTVPFAKQPIRAGGLGGDAGAGAYFRRPSGLRGKLFNYELRMKDETELSSGDSWDFGRPDVHCTLNSFRQGRAAKRNDDCMKID